MNWSWTPTAPAATLLTALWIDILWGELPARIHPVVHMGNVISWAERRFPKTGPRRQMASGAALALLLPSAVALASYALLTSLQPTPWAHWLVESALLTSTFAIRELWLAARRVRDALQSEQLDQAREQLRSLCSRDPSSLDPEQLAASTVESLAENASDSITAPLFFYALFGLPGALFYRVVNTLDAMLGYRDHREYTGKASARLDDLLNVIPARLTAALFLSAGTLLGLPPLRGLRIWWRDARRTDSPNAGHPMACLAGLLGIQLAKAGQYRLGDATQPTSWEHINKCWRVVRLATAIGCSALLAL